MSTEHADSPPVPPPVMLDAERYCIRCGYLLRGLPINRQCPECGTPIELSLREPTIAGASPEYRATLLQGLSFILNGILLMIIVAVASIFLTLAFPNSGVELLTTAVSLGVQAYMLVGYWRYSVPDPSAVAFEPNDAARKVIRVIVLVEVASAGLSTLLQVFATAVGGIPGIAVLAIIAGLIGLVIWAVKFFAVMRYTRWLATRVPDPFIVRRTRKYMWLLPVVYVFGALVIVGPLIALVLYWNLLDRLRKHLKSIIATGERAALKHVNSPMP